MTDTPAVLGASEQLGAMCFVCVVYHGKCATNCLVSRQRTLSNILTSMRSMYGCYGPHTHHLYKLVYAPYTPHTVHTT